MKYSCKTISHIFFQRYLSDTSAYNLHFSWEFVHPSLYCRQGWGEYLTYEYVYWKISTRVVLECNVFSIFMFIILDKTSTRVVLAPALTVGLFYENHDSWGQSWILMPMRDINLPLLSGDRCQPAIPQEHWSPPWTPLEGWGRQQWGREFLGTPYAALLDFPWFPAAVLWFRGLWLKGD